MTIRHEQEHALGALTRLVREIRGHSRYFELAPAPIRWSDRESKSRSSQPVSRCETVSREATPVSNQDGPSPHPSPLPSLLGSGSAFEQPRTQRGSLTPVLLLWAGAAFSPSSLGWCCRSFISPFGWCCLSPLVTMTIKIIKIIEIDVMTISLFLFPHHHHYDIGFELLCLLLGVVGWGLFSHII